MIKSLSWDEYFMAIAIVASLRSKDTNTSVGAVIVDPNKHIVATGYNGFPSGIKERELPKGRDGEWLNTKYPYTVHAELNAILNRTSLDLYGATIYCTLYPCNECAKAIIQSGIKEIVYLENKHKDDDIYKASEKLFSMTNIKIRQLNNFSKEALMIKLMTD